MPLVGVKLPTLKDILRSSCATGSVGDEAPPCAVCSERVPLSCERPKVERLEGNRGFVSMAV